MVQINFGDDLRGFINNEGGGTSKQPLQNWYVSTTEIDGERYFLYIEKDSGLPVLTKQLDSFLRVLDGIVAESGFLATKQRARLMAKVGNVRYRYQPTESTPLMATYQREIVDLEDAMVDALDLHPRWPEIDVSRNLSLELMDLLEGSEVIAVRQRFAGIVNDLWPMKLIKPRVRSKNCTVTPDFQDPREWEAVDGQSVVDNPKAVRAIRANNDKMIAQFLEVVGDDFGSPEEPGGVLNDFLNNFLLTDRIQLVTSNSALANRYSWLALRNYEDDYVGKVLGAFFEFLGRAGIVQWTTSKDVAADLAKTAAIFAGENDRENYELERLADEHPEFRQDPVAYLKREYGEIVAPEQEDELREALKYFVHPRGTEDLDPDQFLSNPANLEKTYEIGVFLKDYKPRMSRKFRVGGEALIGDVTADIIVMFHGMMEHLYDLENPQTGDMYVRQNFLEGAADLEEEYHVINADRATVSLLNSGDKLILHYDYGDSWEFEVTVKKVFNKPGNLIPRVSMAHGYGIIEDIGGVWALADYRAQYQEGTVPAEMKEWLGGDLIDLDKADPQEVNDRVINFVAGIK